MTVNYYIGTKDKDTKEYELSNDYIEHIIKSEFASEYPLGFTISNATGYFRHKDGKVIDEKSYVVTILDIKIVNYQLVYRLKGLLNQESIGIQVIDDVVIFD